MPAVNHLRVVSHSLHHWLRGHIYNLFIAVDSDPGGYRAGRATCWKTPTDTLQALEIGPRTLELGVAP